MSEDKSEVRVNLAKLSDKNFYRRMQEVGASTFAPFDIIKNRHEKEFNAYDSEAMRREAKQMATGKIRGMKQNPIERSVKVGK